VLCDDRIVRPSKQQGIVIHLILLEARERDTEHHILLFTSKFTLEAFYQILQGNKALSTEQSNSKQISIHHPGTIHKAEASLQLANKIQIREGRPGASSKIQSRASNTC